MPGKKRPCLQHQKQTNINTRIRLVMSKEQDNSNIPQDVLNSNHSDHGNVVLPPLLNSLPNASSYNTLNTSASNQGIASGVNHAQVAVPCHFHAMQPVNQSTMSLCNSLPHGGYNHLQSLIQAHANAVPPVYMYGVLPPLHPPLSQLSVQTDPTCSYNMYNNLSSHYSTTPNVFVPPYQPAASQMYLPFASNHNSQTVTDNHAVSSNAVLPHPAAPAHAVSEASVSQRKRERSESIPDAREQPREKRRKLEEPDGHVQKPVATENEKEKELVELKEQVKNLANTVQTLASTISEQNMFS